MKVKNNWLAPRNYAGQENGSFEKKGDDMKNRQLKADFYIVKKKKNATENFSMMLINEFNGLRVSEIRNKSVMSSLANSGEDNSNDRKHPVSESDLKAVNFLNEYWA